MEQLDRSNSDLKNLFDSTKVATVFLDQFLIIRSFTPEIASIYNLIPSDVGRPLTDIVSRLSYTTLREDVQTVLRTLEPMEKRVQRLDGTAHYLMRILPYRTPDSTHRWLPDHVRRMSPASFGPKNISGCWSMN